MSRHGEQRGTSSAQRAQATIANRASCSGSDGANACRHEVRLIARSDEPVASGAQSAPVSGSANGLS